jgi:hypothetical protein
MTNEKIKEVINELLTMTEDERKKVIGYKDVETILHIVLLSEIEERINKYKEERNPKYGDVYISKNLEHKKAVFLTMNNNGSIWALMKYPCPQNLGNIEWFLDNFERTGENVADKLQELFR